MPKFSKQSLDNLNTCDVRLQKLFKQVIKHFDCMVITGHRTQLEQNTAFVKKKSKLKWPHSRHNTTPSSAVDVGPYPINWDDTERFIYFAGFVIGIASKMGIALTWGGDWNRDTQIRDTVFRDLIHFELD